MTRRLVIHGRVQGVWYRGWAVDAARALGLSGWVRNRRDGSVEMLVAGGDEAIRAMIEHCRQGPPAARVERIEVEESDETAPAGFEARPTL
ncbi:MAG TPA: acylphosphatase [Allosphingosinicella sp.]|nr:acylphosphatase [Allosphingosinicella sp.]